VFNSDMLKILEIKCNYDITKNQKKTAKIHKANLSRIFVRCAFTF